MSTPKPSGLDPAQLAARLPSRHNTNQLQRRIGDHLDQHDGYLAFSGGKDSLICLHLALDVEPNIPVVFFDGGLEYPETYDYLDTAANHFGITIDRIASTQPTLTLLAATRAWTHHGPDGESIDLHRFHITDPARQAHQQHGAGEIWGVRADESRGRRALYGNALRAELHRVRTQDCCTTHHPRQAECRALHGGVVRRADNTIAYGPIWNWTTSDVWAHIHRHELPVNPVYAKLRRLGAPEHAMRVAQMVDAGQLHTGRLTWLHRGWPAMFNELAAHLPRMREYL